MDTDTFCNKSIIIPEYDSIGLVKYSGKKKHGKTHNYGVMFMKKSFFDLYVDELVEKTLQMMRLI